MKILKIIVVTLAIFGIICLFKVIMGFYKYEIEAKKYLESCHKITPGMSVKQVREIMGDSTWIEMENSPNLYYSYSAKTYLLDYPTVFAGSEWPIIEFDTLTLRVIKVTCD